MSDTRDPATDKGAREPPLPGDTRWLADALVALSHWSAYQSALYDHWRLPEAAFAAQMWSLMLRFVPTIDWKLTPEFPYSSLPGPTPRNSQRRADIAVGPISDERRSTTGERIVHPVQVFEVKRYMESGSLSGIRDDMEKLWNARSNDSAWMPFVLVVGAGGMKQLDEWFPKRAAGNRTTSRKHFEIPGKSITVRYRVGKVRAVSQFDKQAICPFWAAVLVPISVRANVAGK